MKKNQVVNYVTVGIQSNVNLFALNAALATEGLMLGIENNQTVIKPMFEKVAKKDTFISVGAAGIGNDKNLH